MCTTGIAFSKNATYVFKNRDLVETLKMKPPEIRKGKCAYVAFPRPTGGIWFGVNEKGIGLTASDAHTVRKYPVQRNAGDKITRIYEDIIANASTLKEAEKIMTDSFKKTIKVSDMLIITDSKKASAYEYTPEKQVIRRKTKGALLRANSFLVLKGAPGEKEDPSSHLRYGREKELLSEKISLAQIKKVLRDHVNGSGENSICRHGMKTGEYTTQGSAIVEIKKNIINIYYVANKMPCDSEYIQITLARSTVTS